MKNSIPSTVLFIIFSLLSFECIGQESESSAKSYINNFYDNIVSNYENLAQGQRVPQDLIDQAREECEELEDASTCRSGVNYTLGYFYQQNARKNPDNSFEYNQLARSFYEAVLTEMPNNQAVLKNVALLEKSIGNTEASISRLGQLIDSFPSERSENLVRLGVIYLDQSDTLKACESYARAYQENPFSLAACERIANLYVHSDVLCLNNTSVSEFAFNCQATERSNLSERLLRHQLELSHALALRGDRNLTSESLIEWVNLLAEESWLYPGLILDVRDKLFPPRGRFPASDSDLKTNLNALLKILTVNQVSDIEEWGIWDKDSPTVIMGSGETVAPLDVLFKILLQRGKELADDGLIDEAINYLNIQLSKAKYYNSKAFGKLSKELALLYLQNEDIGGFQYTIDNLFEEKGNSFLIRDPELSREYHILLGEIYYSQKVWDRDGNNRGPKNAVFQLSRAFETSGHYRGLDRLLDPDLRKKLTNVYVDIGETNNAFSNYIETIKDLMYLDRLDEPMMMIDTISNKLSEETIESNREKLMDLRRFLETRLSMENPRSNVISRKEALKAYMERIETLSDFFSRRIEPSFVQLQIFKGLTDLGTNETIEQPEISKYILSKALNYIETATELSTLTDYERMGNIARYLRTEVSNSYRLRDVQYATGKKELKNINWENANMKQYRLMNTDHSVNVPKEYFEFAKSLVDEFETDRQETGKFRYTKGTIKRVNKG